MSSAARPILRLLALALVASAAGVPPPARANLLVNGSFESGPAVPYGLLTISSGSTELTGWAVTMGSVDITTQIYWQAAHLDRSLGLNGSATGAVAQNFPTVPGGVYDVSFWMSGEPASTPPIKNLRVSAAGQSADFSFDSEHVWEWAMDWTPHVWSFTANAATAGLEFRSLDAGANSPVLDNVTVTGPTVSVGAGAGSAELRLAAPRPNPAPGRVTVECSLPRAGLARVAILDLQGREIARLAEGELQAGPHSFVWDGGVRNGRANAEPGIYFVRMTAAGSTRLRRFALIR